MRVLCPIQQCWFLNHSKMELYNNKLSTWTRFPDAIYDSILDILPENRIVNRSRNQYPLPSPLTSTTCIVFVLVWFLYTTCLFFCRERSLFAKHKFAYLLFIICQIAVFAHGHRVNNIDRGLDFKQFRTLSHRASKIPAWKFNGPMQKLFMNSLAKGMENFWSTFPFKQVNFRNGANTSIGSEKNEALCQQTGNVYVWWLCN